MRSFIPISIGAILGANARYWLANVFAASFDAAFPWGTFFINISGSLLIGALLTILEEKKIANPVYRLLLVTGFLGSYTTFSTLSYDTVHLLASGAVVPALFNALGSLALGLGGCFAGIFIAGRRWRPKEALVVEAEQVTPE